MYEELMSVIEGEKEKREMREKKHEYVDEEEKNTGEK
jgi:hypothetical protein